MDNLIKFTFDIRKAVNKSTNYAYNSFGNICNYNEKYFIKQNVIYKDLVKRYNNNNITNAYNRGFCVLTSIYNSFPYMFDYDFSKISDIIVNNIVGDKFANVKYITNYINKLYNDTLLYQHDLLKDSYKIFEYNINDNKSVVITYQYANIIPKYMKQQHAISLFGYNQDYLFYFDNSEGNVLFMSLACYLRDYMANFYDYSWNIPKELIDEYLDRNTSNERLIEIASNILGYNVEHGLSRLKRVFLTDNHIFYDANQIITSNIDNTIENTHYITDNQFSLIDSGKFYRNS